MNMEGSEAPTALIKNHRLVPKAIEALRSDVPSWVLTSARLLYSMTRSGSLGPAILTSLHQDQAPTRGGGTDGPSNTQEEQGLSKVARMLIGLSMGLVEGGAMGGSADALVAGARLMSLVLEAPTLGLRRLGFEALEQRNASKMLVKVISAHRGRNESSEVIGSVSEVLDLMILASLAPSSSPSKSNSKEGITSSTKEADGDESAISSSVLQLLGESGAARDLIQELRPQPKPESATSVLNLLSRLAFTPAGSEQLISSGLLSMCAQIYFSSAAEINWRLSCMDTICDLAQAPRYRVNLSSADTGSQRKETESELKRSIMGIISSKEALTHVIGAILRMIEVKGTSIPPGLHISSLQALVDVADQERVSRAIADAGGIELAVDIINRDLAKEGLYPNEWAIQTKRAAVTLLAVISTHRSLRPLVIETEAIESLCQVMKDNLNDGVGIRQQMRVTAAAALYPILGEDADKLLVRRAAGALDTLVPMLRSLHEAEVKVARKVLEVMMKDEALSRMFEDAAAGVDIKDKRGL